MSDFYIQKSNKSYGPFSGSDLKKLVKRGELTPNLYVTRVSDGKRVKAIEIQGLFEATSTAIAKLDTTIVPQLVRPEVRRVPSVDLVDCPFCGEEIRETARKCKHCGEFLDGSGSVQPQLPLPMQTVNVVNQTVVHAPQQPRWNKGIAMILSFLIPGAGQLYKGEPINAVVWFALVVIGYAAVILPGVFLHLCCIIGAGMGDEYR